jgi:hypothetical protein
MSCARQDGEGPISVSLNGASRRREFPDELALEQRWRERGRRDTTSHRTVRHGLMRAYCCIRKFLMRYCAFSRPALRPFAGLPGDAVALRLPRDLREG